MVLCSFHKGPMRIQGIHGLLLTGFRCENTFHSPNQERYRVLSISSPKVSLGQGHRHDLDILPTSGLQQSHCGHRCLLRAFVPEAMFRSAN